jgi:glycine/D-amino acid oxidase-like deaminating enzyme
MGEFCPSPAVCYKAGMTDLPASADVVIVGAGFAGAATAWALRRLGIAAVVIEREGTLGRFASGRSAGLGRQLAEDDATTQLTVRGAQLAREMPAWTPTGGVLGFDSAARADAYLARAAKFGVPCEPIDRVAVGAYWPELAQLRLARALYVPGDGTIDVAAHLRYLVAGTTVVGAAGATRIERGQVATEKGRIAARVIVDATGAWAGALTGDRPLEAFKRHVFVLDRAVAVRTPWLWYLGDGELYVRRDPAGLLISPCDAVPCGAGHQDADPVGEAQLRKRLEKADSVLADATIRRRWACQRAFAPDRAMRLGRDPDRPWLVWAAALGGHGATAAPAVGERVAEAVVAALAAA